MSETQERDCSECTWLYQCSAEQDDDRPELCVQNPNIITSDSGIGPWRDRNRKTNNHERETDDVSRAVK